MELIKKQAGNTGGSIGVSGTVLFAAENDSPITQTPAQPTSSAAWS